MDTERSPGSKKIPSSSNQASGGSTFISSLDNLVTYLVLGVLVVAINVALIVCIGNLVYILNNPVRDPDIPLPLTFENTTQPDVANKVITSTTTIAATTNPAMQVAEEVKKYMNLSVSPCEDFYSYACGGWHALKEVQDSTVEISSISMMRERTRKQLIDLLRATPKEGDPQYKTEPRKCFAACNNKGNLQERGIKPFLVFLNSIGKFPILDSTWDPNVSFSLPKAIQILSPLNITTIFSIKRRSNQGLIRFRLSREFTTDILAAPLEEFQSYMPQWFNAVDLIKLLAAGNPAEQQKINDKTIVILHPCPYVRDVAKLFHESGGGLDTKTGQPFPPQHIRRAADNYILKTLLSLTSWTDPIFKSLNEFNYPKTNNRETTCMDHVLKLFPEQLLKMYVDEVYQLKTDTYINEMITDVRTAILQRINETNVMDWNEKRTAYRKVEIGEVKAGYLSVETNEALNNVYKLGPTDEFFEYSLETLKHEYNKSLWSPKELWYPLMISFYADPTFFFAGLFDFVVFPAAFFQPPTMSLAWPRSMNYGAMGTYMAHEILRCWSSSGFYASDYENKPDNLKKKKCLIDKYDKYMFQGSKINGKESIKSNIFDNEGIKSSFRAYQNVIKRKGKEQQLTGLNFTHNQLFFISYAQMMCQKIPKSLTDVAVSQNKAPNRIRVLGTLMNFNGFAEVFKCKSDDSMNPPSKCPFI